jgi:hypothetical protein
VFLTCHGTHVNFICELYEISYKPTCRKFLSSWLALPSRFLCKQKNKEKEKRKTLVWELLHPSQFTNPSLSLSLTNGSQPVSLSSPQLFSPNSFMLSEAVDRTLAFLLGSLQIIFFVFFNLINYFFQENWGALTTPPAGVVASENMTIIKSKTIRRRMIEFNLCPFKCYVA